MCIRDRQAAKGVSAIHNDYNKYQENLMEFAKNYDGNGTKKTAKIISEMLES